MCEMSERSSRKRFRGGGTAWKYFEFFQPFFYDVLIQQLSIIHFVMIDNFFAKPWIMDT